MRTFLFCNVTIARACIHGIGYVHYNGRGRGRPVNHPPTPLIPHHTTQFQGDLPTPLTHNNTPQHTTTLHNNTQVNKTTNVPVVFMARYVMILRGATSLLGALEGVGPENLDFFGPKWLQGDLPTHLTHNNTQQHTTHNFAQMALASLMPFQAPKSLDFQGPPFPMPLVMMLHPSKSLCTAP
jgi:hypothetical protein